MFNTANWPDVAIGAGLAPGLAVVVAQLAARAVRLALGTVTEDAASVSFRDPIHRRPIRVIRSAVFVGVLAPVPASLALLWRGEQGVSHTSARSGGDGARLARKQHGAVAQCEAGQPLKDGR